MRRRGWWLVLLVACLLLVQPVPTDAQPAGDPVAQIEEYYLTGRLDRAELEALRLLNKPTGLSDFDRAELNRILAFSAVARDDTELAKTYFLTALQYNPNLRLDRTLTSPKILAVFDVARQEFKQVRILDRESLVNELKSYRLRVEGGRRSLMFPGLGQLHKGQPLRGNAMLGAAGICIVGLVYTQVMVLDAEDRYNRSDDPISAEANFEDYSRYWRWRYGFAFALGAVWAGSVLDGFLSPPNPGAYDRITIEIAYDPGSRASVAGLTVQF